MKKIILGLLLLGSTLLAEVTHTPATPQLIKETTMKIIDIRTKGEWVETGIVKDSYLLTFFDERGNYDIEDFLAKLNMIVDKNEEFALICRTGSRTGMLSNFLGHKLNYKVINLKGGLMKLFREGFEPEYYAPPKK
ncbi:MAG: rhodanese-like domain-containing protein [Epsilonproteobacteria bacterium]|nr:rhodanese-like domain-containing protein [Campylobacterota bacterium]